MRHILVWWALLEALGLIALPLLFRLLSPVSAYGYPFGKIFTLLVVTYVSWILALVGVPFHAALIGTLGALVLLAAWRAWADRAALGAWLGDDGWRTLVRHDLLWTGGFLFFCWQRALAPDIFGAEKYMDFAFLNSLMRTDIMPPQDPWMSGEIFKYYYFGYLAFANLIRLSAIPSHIAYNLCVATVGGLGFAEFGALGLRLTGRWAFGVLAGLCTVVIGNLDGMWQVLEKRTLWNIDYWRSSRVIANGDTINEFPYFSTIHGDLHPHFMVLPVTALLVAILLDRKAFPPRQDFALDNFKRLIPLAVVSFVLGCMVAISNWELPFGMLLVFLLVGRDLPFWPLVSKARLQLAAQFVGVVIVAIVLFLPESMTSTPEAGGGPAFKLAVSKLGEFLTVFGQFLAPLILLAGVESAPLLRRSAEMRQLVYAIVGLAVFAAVLAGNAVIPVVGFLIVALAAVNYSKDDDFWRAPLNLAIVGLIVIFVCEFAYLRDSYGDKLYRMNTVFKLYFQGWLMLAVTVPWAIFALLQRRWSWAPAPQLVTFGCGALLLAACAYPLGLTGMRSGTPWPVTLNGTAYLEREHPDDFAVISWLRENVGGLPVILEATGNPYSYYARFSANTGLPTVLGWANHEGLWRGHDENVGTRIREVETIYNAPSLEAANALLDRYKVQYIVVGEVERKDYQASGLQKFSSLPVAFRHGQAVVYRRQP